MTTKLANIFKIVELVRKIIFTPCPSPPSPHPHYYVTNQPPAQSCFLVTDNISIHSEYT